MLVSTAIQAFLLLYGTISEESDLIKQPKLAKVGIIIGVRDLVKHNVKSDLPYSHNSLNYILYNLFILFVFNKCLCIGVIISFYIGIM